MTALDQRGGDLKRVERDIAQRYADMRWVDIAAASGLAAAIGSIRRFAAAHIGGLSRSSSERASLDSDDPPTVE